jgi:HTH-type transcriptional regulator/antitoxin HigA
MAKRKVIPAWQRVAEQTSRYGQRTALARKLDISRPHLSKLLHGRLKPSLDVAVKLEDVTGIPAREFAVL